ncbi:MAG: protein kinase domain-containing protein [Terriglobales bacterium]
MKNAIGTHIGRYQIDAEIGRGAMGLVYQAHDPKIDRFVAVKTISLQTQEPEEEAEFRERFFLEARAAGRLSHPGIVTIFDVGEDSETLEPYIVMEFVAGQPLNRVLVGDNRRLPLGPALQITQEIAEALNYAHSQGVVHRDIKPANILITLDGHPKIADFGIAKLNQGSMTLAGQVLGSPAYMAPEQLSGESADARSDLFSLGVILYSMLTGFRPFQGNSAATVSFKVVNRDPLPVTTFDSEFPSELDRLVSRSIAKDPGQRYQSGAEMAQDIEQLRQRHELMNQTAASLLAVSNPEMTAKIRIPTPTPTPATASKPLPNPAATATPRFAAPPQTVAPPVFRRPNLSGLLKPVNAALSKITARRPGIAVSQLRQLPKEVVITFASVLLLAIAFVGIELVHSEKPASVIQPANTAQAPVQATNSDAAMPPLLKDTNQDHSAEGEAVPARPKQHHPKPRLAAARPKTKAVEKAAEQEIPQTPPAMITPVKLGPPVAAAATLQNVKATVPPTPATATLDLQIEYQFAEADASVWLDNQLLYSKKLYGESKKRALLFKKVEGTEKISVKVPAGDHSLKVRMQSEADQFDQSQAVSGKFAANSENKLLITCDKHGHEHDLKIALQ